ncbi:CLUMA_CG018280, isoform A [Clunio marinus]|uniref:CLUMA_CG018280, isoform A n=1 Tax=Clunio marinus TaxID=568069 RepID=A0A1J1IZQ5_9DIPT|nr:CLUMA_CG018280, isoform A [Clunio marinus]
MDSTSPRQQHRQEPFSQQQSDQYYQLANETSSEYYCPQTNQEKSNYGLTRDEGSSLLSTTTAALRNCCSNSNSNSTIDLIEGDTYQLFRALTNQLKKERQLETMCQAIEGGLSTEVSNKVHTHQYQPTDCVLVPRQLIHDEEPQVIACRLWRWSDLCDPNEIKRIPKCPNEKDPIYVCCNPAHWSRLCVPEIIYFKSILTVYMMAPRLRPTRLKTSVVKKKEKKSTDFLVHRRHLLLLGGEFLFSGRYSRA